MRTGSPAALLARIRGAVVGDGAVLRGPYGPRRFTYADYIASGRSLAFIADVIATYVLPRYANTHSESSGTGRAITNLREQARATIHAGVRGTSDHVVISAAPA